MTKAANKEVKSRNSKLLVPIFIICLIVIVWIFSLHTDGAPLGSSCLSQSGFFCQNPALHANKFTFSVQQATGANFENVSLLWVPQGQSAPSIVPSCNAPGSETINGGISCAAFIGNWKTEATINSNFTFSAQVQEGSTYNGQIWVEYQNTTGAWHEVRVTNAVYLKAV